MRREQDPTAQAGEIRHFSLGSNLNARDRKAVRRTVSGLTKILHSDRQVEKQDMVRILKFAIEGRRRVKEQLKKMGSFEYYQTSFSHLDSETGEEHYVGVPEQGGQHLISSEPLAPGTLYTGAVSGDGTVGLYRLEITPSGGTGKLKEGICHRAGVGRHVGKWCSSASGCGAGYVV